MSKRVTVECEADLVLPDDAEIREYEGVGTGIEIIMSDGEIIKPWVALETDETRDLTDKEIRERGMHIEHLNRRIIDGPEQLD